MFESGNRKKITFHFALCVSAVEKCDEMFPGL